MQGNGIVSHKLVNLFHTAVLFVAMMGLTAVVGYVLGGLIGLAFAAALAIPLLLLSRQASPQIVLRLYGALPLSANDAPRLYQIIEELSRRAKLPKPPKLYYIPSQAMNAFSVGTRKNSALGVTDGILRALNTRELVGVLAHEVAHIEQNDSRVTAFADLLGRITSVFATIGQILLILNLPLLLAGRDPFAWWAIVLLIVAPFLSFQLRLALSRSREWDADLDGVHLTGDPMGLASALQKLRYQENNLFRRILLPGGGPDPSVLRTHPRTDARIQRLLELAEEQERRVVPDTHDVSSLPEHLTSRVRGPHWHVPGF